MGIVLYGAPGSLVESNVVAAVSRESLGGINLVDPLPHYVMPGSTNRFDYKGDIVRHNFIDALGARIHVGLPMGGPVWGPRSLGTVLVGAEISDNTMAGGAAAYGFVVNGVDQFRVWGNKSIATYSGIGEGVNNKKPPDEPGPFLFDPQHIDGSTLQPEFKPCSRNLVHLLRANHGQTNELGYRVYAYGEAEAKAVVSTAYFEMLQRAPDPAELATQVEWLQEIKKTGDDLRRKLMVSGEFIHRFGKVAPGDLHLYRQKLWLDGLDAEQRKLKQANPWSLALFNGVLLQLNQPANAQASASATKDMPL